MKPHTYTNRSLCECELYTPANYDNDPQMKAVMENYNRQTSDRFKEYDERMQGKRQKCKEQCDKEIQKIVLKDKIDKELTEKFATLQTDIQSDSIPTCVCEKSLADKMEKGCLRCGGLLGGGIAPGWGLVSGLGYVGWTNYVTQTALQKGIEAGLKVGLVKVTQIAKLSLRNQGDKIPAIKVLQKITAGEFTDGLSLHDIFKCISSYMRSQPNNTYEPFSLAVDIMAKQTLSEFNSSYPIPVEAVEKAFANAKEGVLAEGASKTSSLTTGITASLIAIVVIVLIMIIIYLVLRYRRKKKMKKKLQYIKLLEE